MKKTLKNKLVTIQEKSDQEINQQPRKDYKKLILENN